MSFWSTRTLQSYKNKLALDEYCMTRFTSLHMHMDTIIDRQKADCVFVNYFTLWMLKQSCKQFLWVTCE